MRENHSSGSAGASPGNRGRYPEMQMNMDGVNMDGVCPSRLVPRACSERHSGLCLSTTPSLPLCGREQGLALSVPNSTFGSERDLPGNVQKN